VLSQAWLAILDLEEVIVAGMVDSMGAIEAGMVVILVIVAGMVVGMGVNGGLDTTVDGMEVVDITTTGTSA
jgi:hypothetical protein